MLLILPVGEWRRWIHLFCLVVYPLLLSLFTLEFRCNTKHFTISHVHPSKHRHTHTHTHRRPDLLLLCGVERRLGRRRDQQLRRYFRTVRIPLCSTYLVITVLTRLATPGCCRSLIFTRDSGRTGAGAYVSKCASAVVVVVFGELSRAALAAGGEDSCARRPSVAPPAVVRAARGHIGIKLKYSFVIA